MLRVEKVWGMDSLPAPFATPPASPSAMPEGERIGEIWFEPPPQLDSLLVKYLFTSERLSVQVHPSDEQAPAGASGKEECWLVLDAAPGAKLAIGFEQEISSAEMRAAALDGSIERRLQWHPARAGDFFYLPAGTVHAIGPGLSLVEIQQNCDITYRLFDYGRPRALHLEAALAVASGSPHPQELRRSLQPGTDVQLVDGPAFLLDRLAGEPSAATIDRYGGPVLVIPLEGAVTADGVRIEAGECGWAANLRLADFSEAGTSLVAQPAG